MKAHSTIIKEKRINVLHLLSSLGSGGIERLLAGMAEGITADGLNIEVTVIVMNRFVDEALKNELVKHCRQVYFLERKQGHISIRYIRDILKIIKKHDIKIIQAHNYGAKIWAALIKLIVPGIRLIYITHDTLFKLKGINRVSLFLHRYLADCNIAVSKAVLELLKSYRFKNPCLIYNGIDFSKYKPVDEDDFKIESTVKIINVARMDHLVKGQDVLLKAVKLLTDKGCSIRCTFAGSIEGRFKESYEYLVRLAIELGIQNNVIFLGDRKDIPDLLHENNIFILPSRFEGLGLSLLEAMASGIPVIASKVDGPSELISNGVNGLLFESGNEDDLASKICVLAEDPTLRQEIRKNEVQFARKFDVLDMCKKYEEVYRSII